MPKDIKKIKMLILDVDGVMTDGRVYFDGEGREIKVFHAKDGAGLKYWHRAGNRSAVITGRPQSAGLKRRIEELGINHVYQDIKDKIPCFEELLNKEGLKPEEAAYVGDDLTDIPVMRLCGLAVAVSNAVPEVKKIADFVTQTPGGEGAVREAIEYILKGQDKWDAILERYLK